MMRPKEEINRFLLRKIHFTSDKKKKRKKERYNFSLSADYGSSLSEEKKVANLANNRDRAKSPKYRRVESHSLEVLVRGARVHRTVVGYPLADGRGVRFLLGQEPADVSEILVHLAVDRAPLERVRDIGVEFAAERRVPGIVAGGPRQQAGE